ncbi:hypothetical protein ACX31A_15320 [Dermacoccus nishinomiyaensis]
MEPLEWLVFIASRVGYKRLIRWAAVACTASVLILMLGVPLVLGGVAAVQGGEEQKKQDDCPDTATTAGENVVVGPGKTLNLKDPETKRNVVIIVARAIRAGLGKGGAVIGTATSALETGGTIHNLDYGDRDSKGLFQQRPAAGWGDYSQIRNPVMSADAFYGVAKHTHNPGLTDIKGWQKMRLTDAAQAVQGSATPFAYEAWKGGAEKAVNEVWDEANKDPLSKQDTSSSPTPSGSSGGADAQNVGNGCLPNGDVKISGSMEQLLKSWAFPDYKYGRLEQKPGYAAMVAQAKKEGGYTGNPNRVPLGDDCGVFVTNLVVRSGWDKTFNGGGKPSQGAGGTWQIRPWMDAHWKKLPSAKQLKMSDMRPGDVGIMQGHIWIYVGPVAGMKGVWAEASERSSYGPGFSPMFNDSKTILNADNPSTAYYRKK